MGIKRLYKFQPVRKAPADNDAISALFNSEAKFSGRKTFNDLFDSKIDFVRPTPQQILTLLLLPNIDAKKWAFISSWVSDGAITHKGVDFLNRCEAEFNELIDSYPIYCLSCHNTSNLLWTHYASDHTGFCIEFEFPADEPREVIYQEHIGSISLLDLIKHNFSLDSDIAHLAANSEGHSDASADLGHKIHDALLVKLQCWSYEGEYRWIASNAMGRVPKDPGYIKIKYGPEQVKAVIFGCRMSPTVKTHLLEKLPFRTEFQQAVEMKDHIAIVRFDEHKHL
jgi:hypothetical protein